MPEPLTEASGVASAAPVEDRIAEVGRDLAMALRRVIDTLPEPIVRPNQLGRLLGLNRDICGRVLAAARLEDPLAVAQVCPGPEPLRKFLRAARRRAADAGVLAEAEQAIGRFEHLIREQAGDRPALKAIISSLVPTARDRFDLAARQTIFKGTSLLKGAMADMWLHAALVHPSLDDASSHDVAHVYGTLGLRRVRPDTTVKFTYRQFGTESQPWRTIDGRPGQASDGTELDGFCRLSPAPLAVRAAARGEVYVLEGDAVGPRSACDKLLSELRPRAMSRRAGRGARNQKSLFVAPSVPVKTLLFDMLLHEGAYPGAEPVLYVYDTTVEGMASVNDESRDADRLDTHERVQFLGRGSERLGIREFPRYRQMLTSVCERLGWPLDAFRGYRCRIRYPMHGCQVCLAFDAPDGA